MIFSVGSASADPQLTHTYAQWQADIAKAMAGGDAWLDQRAKHGGTKLAIVLDIDNIALETDYNYGVATPEVLDFATHAKSLGFSVLFTSFRIDAGSATADLERVGYPVDRMCPLRLTPRTQGKASRPVVKNSLMLDRPSRQMSVIGPPI